MSDDELREQSIGELFGRLSQQMSALIRQELELAKSELREKGKRAGAGAGLLGGGGLLGIGAFAALTTTLILVLATFLDAWLAALIVTVVYARRRGCAGDVRQEEGPGDRLAGAKAHHRNIEGGRAMGEDPTQIRQQIAQTRERDERHHRRDRLPGRRAGPDEGQGHRHGRPRPGFARRHDGLDQGRRYGHRVVRQGRRARRAAGVGQALTRLSASRSRTRSALHSARSPPDSCSACCCHRPVSRTSGWGQQPIR